MFETITALAKNLAKEGRDLFPGGEDVGNSILQMEGGAPEYAKWLLEAYQEWYSSALPLIRTNLSDRVGEFEEMYKRAIKCARTLLTADSEIKWKLYRIMELAVAEQYAIVNSLPRTIEAESAGYRDLVARHMFEDELAAAEHLLDNGYLREAGIIAGLVLERQLKTVCLKLGVTFDPKETIGALNNRLKTSYSDPSDFTRIQWLNEVRVVCAHDKTASPDRVKVGQMLVGVKSLIGAKLAAPRKQTR